MKRVTLKSKREDKRYIHSVVWSGNNKLKDYDNPETLERIRYAQFNTRAIKDCPFRSAGCERVCYATKGNHSFPDVKASRERSYNDTRRESFSDDMIYTIRTEKESKRYMDATMRMRIHESGDFYSLPYLRAWVRIWSAFCPEDGVKFTNYTKSFAFFLMLTEEEKAIVNQKMREGVLALNWSTDDTTDKEQIIRYLKCVSEFPLANTYAFSEYIANVVHDNECDCADCAKCGTCNKATGTRTVVKIHSASKSDMVAYRENIK